jgi:hypothetical protein
LDALVAAIRRDGAQPIVMTHASRFTDPPRPQDMDWLERARVHTPRARASVIAQFETLVNARIKEWADANGVEVIDLRSAVGGREELFGDLIHFNDAGAAEVASVIRQTSRSAAAGLAPTGPKRNPGRCCSIVSRFSFLFLPITYLMFWSLRSARSRYVWLAVTGYVFIRFWDPRFCLLMAFSTLVSYSAGLAFPQGDIRPASPCCIGCPDHR